MRVAHWTADQQTCDSGSLKPFFFVFTILKIMGGGGGAFEHLQTTGWLLGKQYALICRCLCVTSTERIYRVCIIIWCALCNRVSWPLALRQVWFTDKRSAVSRTCVIISIIITFY